MSARQSLRAVRDGKERGVHVTCEVAPHHFTLTDEALDGAGPSTTPTCKMNPPLREAADRDAMLDGHRRRQRRRDRHRPRAAPRRREERRVRPRAVRHRRPRDGVPIVFDRLRARRAHLARRGWSSCCRSTRRASSACPAARWPKGAAPTSPSWRPTRASRSAPRRSSRSRRTRRSTAGSCAAASPRRSSAAAWSTAIRAVLRRNAASRIR